MVSAIFFSIMVAMTDSPNALTDIEQQLRQRFGAEPLNSKFPSTAFEAKTTGRVAELVLPDDQRGKMPLTKNKYIVRENENLVQWEREVRKFLRKLSPEHENRISAVMVYEWATGIKVTDLVAAGGSTVDLKRINKILRWYFGNSYSTWICGRKVGKCYKVKLGYYITRHRPMTLTLWAEWAEGTLKP